MDGQPGWLRVEGPTNWSRAAFANLDRLPQSEQARWCVWKSVELLYLLSTQDEQETYTIPGSMPNRNIVSVSGGRPVGTWKRIWMSLSPSLP